MRKRNLPLRWEVCAVLLITLIAAALRFYRLPDLPPGLHFDEGFKGVIARTLLEGAPPQIFFESDMGEEPIAHYLVAAAIGLLGQEPWVIRLPSAFVGVLTVPLAWWLGRELFRNRRSQWCGAIQPEQGEEPKSPGGFQGQIVGLGTALVLAILYWHLSFSRIGMEPILVPFFATLAFAALVRGLNTDRWPAFALAGLALGGSLYTYKAGYFVPILAALFVAYAVVVERRFLRGHGRGFLLTALAALIVAAPLGLYFVTHPANFLQRPTSVILMGGESAPESPWQALGDNLPRVLRMFFLQGDANPRSNLPGRPALDPFLALLFLVGLGRALVGFRRPTSALPLIWLGVMTLPTLITEHAPHFGRAIGATPALALLCALGGWTIWQGAARLGRRWVWSLVALLSVGLVFSGVSTARDYFFIWGPSNDLFYAFDAGLVDMAHYIKGLPPQERIYLSPVHTDHPTLLFLLGGIKAKSLDGREGIVLPGDDRATTYLIITREDETSLPLLQRYLPQGEVVFKSRDRNGETYFVAYRVPKGGPVVKPEHPFPIDLERVRFLGFDLSTDSPHRGDLLELTLYWQALGEMEESYSVFTHLLGPYNVATGGPLWGQDDSLPLRGSYPTTRWEKGEIVVDFYHIPIPSEAPAGEYEIEVGMYLLSTLERMPVLGPGGKATASS